MPRRNPALGVGAGLPTIPYDQSGGSMAPGGGMSIPEPGGSMRKMQFEFADPAEQQMQAQQAQMQSAGIPPAGAGGGQPVPQGMPQGQPGGMLGGMAPPPDQMGQGGMSSMLGDDQLAAMLQQGGDMGMMGGGEQMGMEGINPIDLQADQMEQQLATDPDMQMQMILAARRMGGF